MKFGKVLETRTYTILLESGETCSIISQAQMNAFETVVDKLFEKFKIDFNFTKHFRERMSDARNKPCISLKDLSNLIRKLYELIRDGKQSLSKYKDTEVVLKDLQSDLNLPIAVEYDRKADALDVIAKTIMRKKSFTSPDPFLQLK